MVSVQVRLFSRAAGREGRCRQMSVACVGSTRSVPATLGLPRSRVCAFPVYTAPAPGCSIWSGPCLACGSNFRVLHKSTDSVGPAFCAFPALAAQAARSLMGALSPRAMCFVPSGVPASVSPRASRVRAPCVFSGELASSRDPSSRCRPSRWMSTIENLRKSLVRDWEPVCSLVAVPSLGPSLPLSPPRCLLPPAGWTGPPPASSSLGSISPFVLRTASSVFGRLIFSLLLSHSLSCYHTLAPSHCPQGTQAWSLL